MLPAPKTAVPCPKRLRNVLLSILDILFASFQDGRINPGDEKIAENSGLNTQYGRNRLN
jgi:hypothetical protein